MLYFVAHQIYNTSIPGIAAINRCYARFFYPPSRSSTGSGAMGRALRRGDIEPSAVPTYLQSLSIPIAIKPAVRV